MGQCQNYADDIETFSDRMSFHDQLKNTKHNTKACPCDILRFFTAVKMIIFRRKNCDIFLIFAQNKNFGYALEPPQ